MNGYPPDEGFERRPLTLRFEDPTSSTEAYGFTGSAGLTLLEGQLLRPTSGSADTVYVFMHPASALWQLPMPMAMARDGLHVMCCGSRYLQNDSALIMEKVIVDLGAYVRLAREMLGYDKVVLVGWSGGGSLSLFYQDQALEPTITQTPAGDPVDIAAAGLIPADGIVFVAAHMSRARILSEWLDPSVLDESSPEKREIELDLYSPDNPNQPPYRPDYLAAFRAAQVERMHRITRWVHHELERLRTRGGAEQERAFVVHRTLADPRFLDPTLEPSERRPNWCFLGNPETVNVGPNGLARFSSLRSWLSQWSLENSAADGPQAASRISTPLLVIENGADDAVPPSHPRTVFEASASPDKTQIAIPGATHFYQAQPSELTQALEALNTWRGPRSL